MFFFDPVKIPKDRRLLVTGSYKLYVIQLPTTKYIKYITKSTLSFRSGVMKVKLGLVLRVKLTKDEALLMKKGRPSGNHTPQLGQINPPPTPHLK